ncbi:hypothetical protein F7Q99_15325 [Streptomyces kaniharaensis]|uniref:Lipoprotein n=1 Tax=Streptomyces kaniharaensis TaxID=212423 RepID=A0A6N7KVI4_9ACTN|nr:hypothetical protein [Streptomyces kaniharaensis]MQS13603.1 hypothetical protein [Streptomyces kaniharaensis]
MIVKRAAVVGGVVLALAAVAGCGGDARTGNGNAASPSATSERLESATGGTILSAGHKEFAQAKSVKITGSEVEGGQKTTFTISAAANGDCAGSFDFGTGQGRAELLRAAGQTLVKEDAQLLAKQGGAKAVELGKDRWIRIKPGDDLASITTFCELKGIPVFGDGDWYKQVFSDGTTTVNGQKAVTVVSSTQKDGAFNGYVAVDGPARPVRVESSHVEGSTDGTTMDFSDYDAQVTVSLPPADQIIDLTSIKQSATGS